MTAQAGYAKNLPNVDELVSNHLDLVQKIAWHLFGRVNSVIEIEDLVQIGYFGLITAAQKYTPQEGASFASYASMRIRGAMVDHLRKNSNLCRTTIQMRQKAQAIEQSLTQKLQRAPHDQEMADAMGLSAEQWQDWQNAFAANRHESLDNVYDDYSIWFASGEGSPEDHLSDVDLRKLLRKALETLPEREALVVQLFYVEELNIYEVAAILDVSTGRVSQIKKSAIQRLREQIKRDQGDID